MHGFENYGSLGGSDLSGNNFGEQFSPSSVEPAYDLSFDSNRCGDEQPLNEAEFPVCPCLRGIGETEANPMVVLDDTGHGEGSRVEVHDRETQPMAGLRSEADIVASVRRLGDAIADEAIVLSSGASFMALGGDSRAPCDVDIALPPEAVAYLRSQEGWEEDNGSLRNGEYDIGPGWGDQSYESLKERSWETESGIKVASLSDVVSWKTWERGDAKDMADIEEIRGRLLDPTKPPLPSRVIKDEIEIARAVLPEHLRDDPNAQVAIELAANGLATVRALYGDDRIGRPNRIVGDLERPDHLVVATYHNGFGLPDDMRTLQQHMDNIGATDEQRLRAMVADAYSDIVYGNGRKSDNPGGYDELRSARLLEAHMLARGYSPEQAAEYRETVLGTVFSEQTGRQQGRHHPDPAVRGVAGVDLHTLSEPAGVPGSFDIGVEDMISARYSPSRTLGRAASEQGARISSTEEALQFIDENPDLRPSNAPEGPTIKQALGNRLIANAGFFDPDSGKGYAYPDGWTLEDQEVRREGAKELRRIGTSILAGGMTAQDGLREAREYQERWEAVGEY
ncbi:MAG TPA: hypothetical protein VF809_00220 [Candidatus Saccharimonadales bacterium]